MRANKTMPSSANEIKPLTGLRGLAALWVTLGHFVSIAQEAFPIHGLSEFSFYVSWTAVDLFFLLSGFVMLYVHRQGAQTFKAYGRFMWKRFARIYPLYILSILLWVGLLGHVSDGPAPTGADWVKYVTLIQTWWGYTHYLWLPPTWSLSAEWGAYLLFPVFFFLVQRISRSHIPIGIILISLVYTGLHVVYGDVMRTIGASALSRSLPCFFLGMLAYRLSEKPMLSSGIVTDSLSLLILILIPAIYFYSYFSPGNGFILLPVYLWWMLFLSHNKGFTARLMTTKPMMFLGRISYSLYLLHLIVYWGSLKIVSKETLHHLPDWQTGVYLLSLFLFSILFSWLVYWLWEKPAQSFLRHSK